MFYYFLIAAFCGFGFIIGAFLTLIVCMSMPRRFSTERNKITDAFQRESLDAMHERNAQWRANQLDYFAAAAIQGILAKDFMERENMTPDRRADHAFQIARAMVDESAKHKGYLPPVPPDISDLLPSTGRQD